MKLLNGKIMLKLMIICLQTQLISESQADFIDIAPRTMEIQDSMGLKSLTIYQCLQCDYSTNRRSNFCTHTKIHSGVKRFICSLCQKAFTLKHHLLRHLLVHERDTSRSVIEKLVKDIQDLRKK